MDTGCICKGNWRELVKETRHLWGKKYHDHLGREFIFLGLADCTDDYYYLMWSKKYGMQLLSCVGDLEGHMYTEIVDSWYSTRKV